MGTCEVALMQLFGTTLSRRIVSGTGLTLRGITDQDNHALYPTFFRTHLVIPPPLLLDAFQVWENASIGVQVRRYGRMILDCTGVLREPGALSPDGNWNLSKYVSLRGFSMFVVDRPEGESQIASPREGALSEMPVLEARPPETDLLRRARSGENLRPEFSGPLIADLPGVYLVLPHRDAAPGRFMMFSTFSTILDAVEQALLTDHLWPPPPQDLLASRQLLEREVYYCGNVQAGSTIGARISATVSECPPELAEIYPRHIGAAQLSTFTQLYVEGTQMLLAVAYTKKVFAIPRGRPILRQSAARFLSQHGSGNGKLR